MAKIIDLTEALQRAKNKAMLREMSVPELYALKHSLKDGFNADSDLDESYIEFITDLIQENMFGK